MKNAAKLVLFLSVCFIGLLLISGLAALLQGWIDEITLFPPAEELSASFSGKIAAHLESSIAIAFYLAILLGLNYAARRRIAYPAAFAIILVFTLILSGGVFFGLKNLGKTGFDITFKRTTASLARPGFLLNQGVLSGYQTAFLEDPQKPAGAVVLLTDAQSFNYQGEGAPITKTQLPVISQKKGMLYGIEKDFEYSSRIFSVWFKSSIISYVVYAGSLAAFLLSLGCLVNISFWPLANLIFGALAFRGVLALENFLNQGDIRNMLASFAGKIINPSLINPLIFFFLCILILLYSGLVYLARGKTNDG